jgi:hypothetical protein
MQLRQRTVQALALGVVTVWFAACGGGGSSAGSGTSSSGGTTTTYYSDVVGIGFADSPRRVPVGQWPSWFAADALVTGCSTGQSFYLDQCWDDMEVNLDSGTVTFSTGARTAVLQVGAPLPAEIGPVKEHAHGRPHDFDDGWQEWAVTENAGPGYIQVVYDGTALLIASESDLWGALLVLNGGARSQNEPWAVHGALQTVNGLLTGLVVKTTVAFGMEALDQFGVQCRIAHNWTPKGRLIVAGARLEFPTTLEDVAAVVGQPVMAGGEAYVDAVQVRPKLSVRSTNLLKQRRTTCEETNQALLTNHLVTSIAWRSL